MALIVLAAYGPILAPHDFWYARLLVDGQRPPFTPRPEFPLGSDFGGHDLLSWLLIGARTTLLIALGATLLRMVIGGFFGTFAGWQRGRADEILSAIALAFSSVPGTILAILGVLAFNVRVGPLAFVLALGLLGWGDAFHTARRHARAEAASQVIESARALGMSETRVVLRHLLPSIAPTFLTLTALQASAVLLLFAELGLVRLFVGGATVFDVDPRTNLPTVVLPITPDWSSMLAGTRPIAALYFAAHTILVPGIALLAAVMVTGLLGDGLARRARRFNVYSVLSRRQALALGLALATVVAPALLWPSPLAPGLSAAERLRGEAALATARTLASPELEGRVAGSAGALHAAELIARVWEGELQPVTGDVLAIKSAVIRSPLGTLDMTGDLTPLSPTAASVRGSVVEPPAVIRGFGPGTYLGDVVVVRALDPLRRALGVQAATIGQAAALVIVSDDLGRYSASPSYRVPTVRIGSAALAELVGIDRAITRDTDIPLPLMEISLSIEVQERPFAAANVVARAPGSTREAPIILIFLAYDRPPRTRYLGADPGWGGASSPGVVAELLTEVRERPLPVEVIAVAIGGDYYQGAGTGAFLGSLPTPEARRVMAAVSVGALASGRPALQVSASDISAGAASASSRVAGRVAEALGLRLYPTSLALRDSLTSARISVPVFGLADFDADPPAPDANMLRSSARALYVLVSYLATHPEELQR